MTSHRRTWLFSGHVQGVGFRYTTQNIALRFDVHGYVRNLPDGRVEVVAEGPDSQLDEFLEAIRDKMGGHIRDVKHDEQPMTGQFSQFCVRH